MASKISSPLISVWSACFDDFPRKTEAPSRLGSKKQQKTHSYPTHSPTTHSYPYLWFNAAYEEQKKTWTRITKKPHCVDNVHDPSQVEHFVAENIGGLLVEIDGHHLRVLPRVLIRSRHADRSLKDKMKHLIVTSSINQSNDHSCAILVPVLESACVIWISTQISPTVKVFHTLRATNTLEIQRRTIGSPKGPSYFTLWFNWVHKHDQILETTNFSMWVSKLIFYPEHIKWTSDSRTSISDAPSTCCVLEMMFCEFSDPLMKYRKKTLGKHFGAKLGGLKFALFSQGPVGSPLSNPYEIPQKNRGKTLWSQTWRVKVCPFQPGTRGVAVIKPVWNIAKKPWEDTLEPNLAG